MRDAPLDWGYGRNDYDLLIDDQLRNFVIHVPELYPGDEEVPLVFMLHGTGGTGDRFYQISGWVGQAEREGFIAIFPTALEYPSVELGLWQTKWSAGGLEQVIPEGYPIKDDVPFLRELISLCRQTFLIDERRIYISGFSNGGGFVKSRVIPEMADVFAAASTVGGPGIPVQYPIQGARYMPLFTMVGTKDALVMESAGITGEIPISAEGFLAVPTFQTAVTNMLEMLRLANSFTEAPAPPSHNLILFSDDQSSQGNECRYMIVKDLEHRYPNGRNNPQGIVAADYFWTWFRAFSLEATEPTVPKLFIRRDADQIVVSWPVTSDEWVLERSDDLIDWSAPAAEPERIGDLMELRDTATGQSRFFRLRKPEFQEAL